jgi:hypothetical protein
MRFDDDGGNPYVRHNPAQEIGNFAHLRQSQSRSPRGNADIPVFFSHSTHSLAKAG